MVLSTRAIVVKTMTLTTITHNQPAAKKTVVKMFMQKSKLTWTEAKEFCAKQDKMELASRGAICPGDKPFDAPESNTGLWVPINGAKKDYMYYAKSIPNLGGAGKHLEACMTHASWPGHNGATAGWADNHSNDKLKSYRVYVGAQK